MRGFWKRSTGLLAVLELAACRQEEPETTWKETNRAVLEWSIASRELVPNMVGGFVPHPRQVAFTHAAMHDAINSIRHRDGSPVAASANASPEAAAIAAAHFMLVRLHPERQAELDERYSTSLAALPDSAGKTEGSGRPAPGYDTSPGRLWRHLALGQTVALAGRGLQSRGPCLAPRALPPHVPTSYPCARPLVRSPTHSTYRKPEIWTFPAPHQLNTNKLANLFTPGS